MTFPVVAAQTSAITATSQSSHSVTLPASIQAGELLVLVLSFGDSAISINTGLAGWTAVLTDQSNTPTFRSYRKFAVAGDAGSTLTIVTSTSTQMQANVYRITGAHASTPPEASGLRHAGPPYDAPAHTASWGAADTLWLTGATIRRHITTNVAGLPLNFLQLTPYQESGQTVPSVASIVAMVESPTSSVNPEGDYGPVDASDWFIVSSIAAPAEVTRDCYLWTMAIRPAASLTKKLKVLVAPGAQGDSGVAGVVFNAPAGSDITGPKLGEFTGRTFEATLESGQAVLKVPVADFGALGLTTSDTPVALVRNSTDTTGIIPCTVIEE